MVKTLRLPWTLRQVKAKLIQQKITWEEQNKEDQICIFKAIVKQHAKMEKRKMSFPCECMFCMQMYVEEPDKYLIGENDGYKEQLGDN
jgi:hypothetical protein